MKNNEGKNIFMNLETTNIKNIIQNLEDNLYINPDDLRLQHELTTFKKLLKELEAQ
jgi:hypothetical protein